MSLRQPYGTKDAPARDGGTTLAGNRLGAVLSAGFCRPCALAPTTPRTGVGLNDLDKFEQQVGALECNICTYPLQPQSEEEERDGIIYKEHRAVVGPRDKYKYWAVACSSYPFPHMFHMVCIAKHAKQTQARVQTCPDCRQELANELSSDPDMRKIMDIYGKEIRRYSRPTPAPPPPPEALTAFDHRTFLYKNLFFYRAHRWFQFGREDVFHLTPSRVDTIALSNHMQQIKTAVVGVTVGTAQERSPVREYIEKIAGSLLIRNEEESDEDENRRSTRNLYNAILELYYYSFPVGYQVSSSMIFQKTYAVFMKGRYAIQDNTAGVNADELLKLAGIVAIAYACTALVSKDAFYHGFMMDFTEENASYVRRSIVAPTLTAYLFATHPFYKKGLYRDAMLQGTMLNQTPALLHGFMKAWSKVVEDIKRDYDAYRDIPSNPPKIGTTWVIGARGNTRVREAYFELNKGQPLGEDRHAIIDSMFDFFTELKHAKEVFAWDVR